MCVNIFCNRKFRSQILLAERLMKRERTEGLEAGR